MLEVLWFLEKNIYAGETKQGRLMKVGELISLLQQHDEELDIKIFSNQWGSHMDVYSISLGKNELLGNDDDVVLIGVESRWG
uniref:Uncharacterized protein n=1 Tax=viral metagenome TaxID=1070528 RepID=A0A6M3LCT1_9ZZZZ